MRDYTLDSLLTNISEVFQKVYLFADTIENNIKFGKPAASHEEVIAAAKKACCHEFILSLPDGYNTVIGEGGATLSGGEKQRISIARAILKDAPIIMGRVKTEEARKGIQLADELSDMILFHNRVYQDVLVVNTVIIRIMEYSVCKVKGNESETVHCLLCRLL